MKNMIVKISAILGMAFVSSAFAGTNPIGWSLSPSTGFPSTTKVGSSYQVTYTLTNNLPFAVAVSVTGSYSGGTFTMHNGCNRTLQHNGTCLVALTLQPQSAGSKTAQITVAYDKNKVPLPQLSTTSSSVGPTDKISGHITTPLPPITYTGQSYDVEFAYSNSSSTSVTATSVDVTGFTASTNTCTSALTKSNSPCTVSGTFTPSATGQTSLSVTYNYTDGSAKSVPLVTHTDVQSGGGTTHHVSASAALPLPVTTYQYADNVVRFDFVNQGTGSETLGTVSLASAGGVSATLTKGSDTCSGQTLGTTSPSDTCSVYVSVVPTTSGSNLAVTASVPYNSSTQTATATTSESVSALTNQDTLHTVMFVNQCDEDVWYEFQNNTGANKSADPSAGGTFDSYRIPGRVTGKAPSTKVLSISEYINGAIYARTQCNESTGICATANCPVISGQGTCTANVGATTPATIFELNMSGTVANDGVYDVSLINGFNVPGQIKSLAPIGSDTFGCGQSAGALIQPSGSSLGACPWTFTPPSTGIDSTANYYFVEAGADDACTPSTNCGTGNVCGTAFNSASDPGSTPLNRRCGGFLGYWTVANMVGYASGSQWGSQNLYDLYSLGSSLPTGPQGTYGFLSGTSTPATYASLYACVLTSNGSLNTGYGYTQNVCGCYNWNQAGSDVPTAQASNCTATNSDWINTVYPRIKWLKEACPTAYSFQYDDPSVSFTCNVAQQKTSYQVTFCPGGKKGTPA